MGDIRLIATDLDGTLVGHIADFQQYEQLRERIITYRRRYNTVWATCTGRSLSSTKQFLRPMEDLGIRPDFIIVSHAYIYEYTHLGYMPHLGWNLRIRRIFLENSRALKKTVDKWHRAITGASLGVITMYRRKNRLRIRFRSEEGAVVAERMLNQDAGRHPYLRVVRSSREIDVFQLPFTKGLAVAELAGHLIIDKSEVLTIGDAHNDISMLDKSVANYSACPANAEAEVQYLVHSNGGHVARNRELAGVVEILDAYLENKVNSELPAGWRPGEVKMSGLQTDDEATSPHTGGFQRSLLFVMVTVTILMVVAWFNVLPFSGYILKPFYLMIKALEKLVSIFV